jgi:hypothetical protein
MYIYWNIPTMHGPMNVKSPNNTSKWQMEFNSAFKGLMHVGNLSAQASKGGHYFQGISVSNFNYYFTSAPHSFTITGNNMYCNSKRLGFN